MYIFAAPFKFHLSQVLVLSDVKSFFHPSMIMYLDVLSQSLGIQITKLSPGIKCQWIIYSVERVQNMATALDCSLAWIQERKALWRWIQTHTHTHIQVHTLQVGCVIKWYGPVYQPETELVRNWSVTFSYKTYLKCMNLILVHNIFLHNQFEVYELDNVLAGFLKDSKFLIHFKLSGA